MVRQHGQQLDREIGIQLSNLQTTVLLRVFVARERSRNGEGVSTIYPCVNDSTPHSNLNDFKLNLVLELYIIGEINFT
jgi:hypothetical protein